MADEDVNVNANKSFFERMKKNKTWVILSISFVSVSLLAGLSFYFFVSRDYALSSDVKNSMVVIPEDVSSFVEIKNLKSLKERWGKSSLSEKIKNNNGWQNLQNSSGFRKASSVLYFLKLKSGFLADFVELESFFENTIGFAVFKNNSWLTVAKTNLKSKFGAALLSAFEADKVDLPVQAAPEKKENQNTPQNAPRSSDNNSAPVYVPAFSEESVSVANLRVSKIQVMHEFIYFVLLDDFLFISDNLDTLKASLELASAPSSKSLAEKKGFEILQEEFNKEDTHALVYFSGTSSLASPFFNITHNGTGTALVISSPVGQNISVFVYAIENPDALSAEKKTAAAENIDWENRLPDDSVFTFLSREKNINEIYGSLKKLDDSFKNLKTGSEQFFQKAKIKLDQQMNETRGFVLTSHDFEMIDEMVVPNFSLAYKSQKENFSLAQALYKSSKTEKRNFQNMVYYKMKHKKQKYYLPAYANINNFMVQSSSQKNLEKFISVSKGNRPSLSDLKSYQMLKEYKNAPFHAVLNIPKLIENLTVFFNYGAEKTSEYSKITIDKQIKPLFEPFAEYQTIHIAAGMNKNPVGMMVISDK